MRNSPEVGGDGRCSGSEGGHGQAEEEEEGGWATECEGNSNNRRPHMGRSNERPGDTVNIVTGGENVASRMC